MQIRAPTQKHLSADLVAGLTFAVANIPSAMAHALMAGVNPVLGIYTLIASTPVGALFTSSVYMNVSTTSALAMAAGSSLLYYPADSKAQALASLVLLVGIIQLLLGLFRMGSLLRFVPHSVMIGFINGVAVLIILGQVADLTGYNSSYENKVFRTLDTILHWQDIQFPSLLVGLLTIAIILLLNRTKLRKVSSIIALIGATLLVEALVIGGIEVISDIATLPTRLPRPQLPSFSLMVALFVPALSVAIVGLVQGAAVSQNYPNPDGKFPDASRDFLGQGAANMAASLLGGIPAGGSSSGTALTVGSGAQTRWTNIFAGLFVVLGILLLSPIISLIPMPALAGLVMLAGFQTLRVQEALTVWQTGAVSGTAMLLTFGLTLFIPLQYAVLVGVAFSILLYVFNESNRVKVVQVVPVEDGLPYEVPAPRKLPSNDVIILTIFGSVFFAATQAIESGLPDPSESDHAVVILRLRNQADLGSTFIALLHRYQDSLRERRSLLMLSGIDEVVRDRLDRSGFTKTIGAENIYMKKPRFGDATNQALSDARAWLDAHPMD